MIEFSIFISKYFTNSFFLCYTYAVLLLLGVIMFKNKFTLEARNSLYVFNMLMGYVSLLGLLYWILELFVAWYGQNPYELWAFYYEGYGWPSNPMVFYVFTLLPSFLGLFFLNKKLRLRIWFVITFLVVFSAGAIWNWLLQFDKDYLPSTWTLLPETFLERISRCILVPVVLIFTYWVLHKRNKLPFPSLFFKRNVQPL